jgi:hypothetical protein
MTTLLIFVLTPFVLLAVVKFLTWPCPFTPGTAVPTLLTPVVGMASARETTLTATLKNIYDNELLVATLQWGGPPTPTPTFTITGSSLYPTKAVNNGNPFSWNGMNIQVFANNVDNPPKDGNLAIKVTLPAPSPVPWSLCVWPYQTLAKNPLFGAVSTDPDFAGVEIKTPEPLTLTQYDALYAVAFAADEPATSGSNGAFPGSNSLSGPGWGLVTYNNNSDPLLIGFLATAQGTGTVTPLAINKPTNPTNTKPKGFMIALVIKWGV